MTIDLLEVPIETGIRLVEVEVPGLQGPRGLAGDGDFMLVSDDIVGDGVADDGPAINAILQHIKTTYGRGIARFKAGLRYYTSVSLSIPDRIGLVGSLYTMANLNGVDGAQLIYGGADAGVICENGELDTKKSQGLFMQNLGIEITQAGAIGFRAKHTDGLSLYNVGVRLAAANQRGFHFLAERGGGAFEGNYDVNAIFLQVINTNGSAGCTHIDMTAEDDHGQNNTCWFAKCSTRGRGTHWRMAASETCVIDTPRCEGFDTLALDVVGKTNDLDVRSMYMEPHADWSGHAEGGTDKVISFLNGGTLSRRARIRQPGFNGSSIASYDFDLADSCVATVGNTEYWGDVNTNNYRKVRVIGEAFNRIEEKSAGRYAVGGGTAAPIETMFPGGATTPGTTYTQSVNAGNLNHSVQSGLSVNWVLDISTVNKIINIPTGIIVGDPFITYFVDNTGVGAGTFHFSSSWRVSAAVAAAFNSLNYSLAAGKKLTILGQYNGHDGKWHVISYAEF